MNLDKYPKWNPFIHHAMDTAKAGEKVDITFRSGSKETILHCNVVKVELIKELHWKYHVILPGLLRGEQSFIVELIENSRVRFIRAGNTQLLIRFIASQRY